MWVYLGTGLPLQCFDYTIWKQCSWLRLKINLYENNIIHMKTIYMQVTEMGWVKVI